MKRILLLGTVICILLCAITACNGTKQEETTDTVPLSEPLLETLTFQSFEEYEQYEKQAKATPDGYYVPATLPEGSELKRISKREGVYVSAVFNVPTEVKVGESLSEYDRERLHTLTCVYYLYEDGSIALQNTFIPNGFKPVEYNGKEYYCMTEYATGTSEQIPTGYEIVFLEDGQLIYMHLPALDTLESMMKYADVVKVTPS